MTDGEGVTPLEDAPSAPTTTLVASRPDTDAETGGGGNGDGHAPTTATDEAVTDEQTGPRRPVDGAMSYNPALDGIRGLAVGAVLLFHQGFGWAKGGYLGVSTFFTLSGFLITSLLITEHRRKHSIGLTAFWARRLRRLMPAAAATLAIIMLSALFTDELWERSLRGDVIAAALNVANWRFLFQDQSYAGLFTDARSPILHFWSLAIEEQFYWVFPLLTAVVFARTKGSLKAFGGVLLGLLGVSAVLTLVFSDHHNTVYYSTPIRMGEILVGALLAVGLAITRGRLTTTEGSSRTTIVATLLGGAALAASVWAWHSVNQATSNKLYQGGLLVYAVASGCLVFAACVPGPVRRLLAFEPLRLLGLVSYGVYLIHWPVFLYLDEKRADDLLDPFNLHPRGVKLFAVRLAVTLVLAIASFRWLEQPIRRGRRPKSLRAPVLAAGSLVSVVLIAVVVPVVSKPPSDEFTDEQKRYLEAAAGLAPEDLAPDAKIGVTYGDSTMLRVAFGLSAWGAANKRMVLVGGGGGVGCIVGQGGEVRYGPTPGPVSTDYACTHMKEEAVKKVGEGRSHYGHVDFAFMMAGPWDVSDRKLPGDDQWRHIGDPVYDDFLRSELERATDTLLEQGLTVIWVTQPYMRDNSDPEDDPHRMDLFNQMITEIADARDGVVIVDLAGYIDGLPTEEDEHLRPDGVHLDADTTTEVAEDFLGEKMMEATTLETSPYAEAAAGPPPTTGP